MGKVEEPLSKAIDVLNENLSEVIRVNEWAQKMGYNKSQKFTYCFLKHYGVRPHKVMIYIRLKSIIHQLKSNEENSNLEIAQAHGLSEEKALNNFTNYHLGLSPTKLKCMSKNKLSDCFEKFGNKVKEQN